MDLFITHLFGARAAVLLGVLRDLTGVERDGGEGAAPVHEARLAGGAEHGVGVVVAAAPPSAPCVQDDFDQFCKSTVGVGCFPDIP